MTAAPHRAPPPPASGGRRPAAPRDPKTGAVAVAVVVAVSAASACALNNNPARTKDEILDMTFTLELKACDLRFKAFRPRGTARSAPAPAIRRVAPDHAAATPAAAPAVVRSRTVLSWSSMVAIWSSSSVTAICAGTRDQRALWMCLQPALGIHRRQQYHPARQYSVLCPGWRRRGVQGTGRTAGKRACISGEEAMSHQTLATNYHGERRHHQVHRPVTSGVSVGREYR